MKHKRAVLIVLAFTIGGSLYFYTFTTYMQKYLVNTAHMDPKIVTGIMTVALVIYMCLQPVFGALSDRIGRKNNMLCSRLSRADLRAATRRARPRHQPLFRREPGPDRAGDRLVLHRD